MDKTWLLTWSDKFVSGNEEIDCCHKEILENVAKLYDMLADSAKFKDDIAKLTHKIEEILFIHMETEIDYFKKCNLPNWKEHEKEHNYYKQKFNFYKGHLMPVVIRAVLTGEMVLEYMNTHFFESDLTDLRSLKK